MDINKSVILSRIVGVEEHVAFPELISQLPEPAGVERGYPSRDKPCGSGPADKEAVLAETEQRLQLLDGAGLTMQVLSYPMAGADLLTPRKAEQWAREVNNRIAAHPSRAFLDSREIANALAEAPWQREVF